MSRLTRSHLDNRACRAAEALGLPLEDIWLQRSETGYGVFRTFGAGAQALAECLTAAEADQFLRGLAIGADMTSSVFASVSLQHGAQS
jgi:2-keto-3-deoxy-galactonokinase